MIILKNYNCGCIKCKKSFISHDTGDYDGESFCPECRKRNQEIAAKVDAIITNKRKNEPNKPKVSMFDYEKIRKAKKGSTTYLNI